MLVIDKVKEIVATQFDLDEEDLLEETSFVEDLHADSIDLVHLAMTFEDEYGIELEDDALMNIKTIEDAVEYIEKNINE